MVRQRSVAGGGNFFLARLRRFYSAHTKKSAIFCRFFFSFAFFPTRARTYAVRIVWYMTVRSAVYFPLFFFPIIIILLTSICGHVNRCVLYQPSTHSGGTRKTNIITARGLRGEKRQGPISFSAQTRLSIYTSLKTKSSLHLKKKNLCFFMK